MQYALTLSLALLSCGALFPTSARATSARGGNLGSEPGASSTRRESSVAFVRVAGMKEAAAVARADEGSGTPPNILLVILDDVGTDQLRAYDANHGITGLDPGENLYVNPYPYALTPNITRVASEGVRFTRAFASPVCSPSRAQIHTGRYPFRTGLGGIVTPSSMGAKKPHKPQDPDLPLSEYSLPEVLGDFASTYERAYFGKWHLAAAKCHPLLLEDVDTYGDDHPVATGWPIYRGLIRNLMGQPNPIIDQCDIDKKRSDYYTNFYYVHSEPSPLPPEECLGAPIPGFCVPSNTLVQRDIVTDFLVTHEREDVEEFCLQAAEPWCAVWASQACHGPFTWWPEELHSYGSAPETTDTPFYNLLYRSLLESLDTEIGRLRDALDVGLSDTLWDRTLVIIIGDNGTDGQAVRTGEGAYPGLFEGYVAPVEADPLRGRRFKGSAYHSGTNMPMIISGPGVVGDGRVSKDLVSVTDIFSTIRDYACVPDNWVDTTVLGYDGRTIDGLSLRPALELTGAVGHDQVLSLHFSENGVYLPGPPPDFIEAGFVFTAADGNVYHLVRRKIADPNDSAALLDLDQLYHLWTDLGAPVDVAEKFALDLVANSVIYLEGVFAYDTLLASP